MSDAGAATGPAPAPSGRRDVLIDAAWIAVLFAWAAAWCLSASARLGVTYDEPFYMDAGMDGWRKWWAEMPALNGVMPLPTSAATLPVYAREAWTGEKITATVEYVRRARPVTLGWLLLLLVSALRLGRAAGGPWSGRVAAALIAADPNFLAHSSLATTDVAVTATLMALARAAYAGRPGGWWRRVVLPGLWFGVAVLCKLSAMLYGGIILTVLEVAYRFSSGGLARPAGAGLRRWAAVALGATARSVLAVAASISLGLAVVVVSCGISPEGARPFAVVAKAIPTWEPLRPKFDEWAEKYDRVPYAVVAFAFQWWHTSGGRPTFLNGTYYPHGVWFYFPVLLAMKLPIPVMLLGLGSLFRPRAAFTAVAATALALFAVMFTAKLQIGVRLMLPVMAVGYAAVAVAVCRGYGRWGVRAGLAAAAVTAATSLWVWPHGLGYLNQLAGGPGAAHGRVTDSNLDWGQGVPDLLEWHRANGEPPTAVWYFGTDPAARKPPFEQLFVEGSRITTGEEFRAVVGRRVLAVGTTIHTLHPFDPPPKGAAMRYLLSVKPVARTATFVVYDFRPPDPRNP